MSTAIAMPPMPAAAPMSVTPPPIRSVAVEPTPPPIVIPDPSRVGDLIHLPGFVEAVELRRFTAMEFEKLVEFGILTDEDRVELINGYVVKKMSRNPAHDISLTIFNMWFYRNVPNTFTVRSQCGAVFIDDRPKPDLAVARGGIDQYRTRHPGVGDFILAIEIADSSLRIDRVAKCRMYAGVAIPEYWIVNIPERQIEVYTDPTGTGENAAYRIRRDYLEADSVPVVLDGTSVGAVPVKDLLP